MGSYHSSPTPWFVFLSGTLLHEIESHGYYDNSLGEVSHPVTSPTRISESCCTRAAVTCGPVTQVSSFTP